jgi:YD repeat-containing protein
LTITYPGTAGTPRQIQIITGALAGSLRSDSTNGNYTLMSIGALFPNSGQGTSSNYNPTVASMINLPDASQYAFKYNSYGELARVTLPSGGSIEYDYGDGLPNAHDNTNGSNNGYETASNGTNAVMIYRRLLTRREYANGGTGATYSSKTTHTVAYPPGQTTDTVQVSDSTNGVISQTVHTMSGAPTDALTLTATSCNDAMEGVEVQTDTGTTATAVITVKNGYPATSGCTNNPLPDTRTTILVDASKQSEIGYTYDRYGNVSDEKDYDWTSIGSTHGNLLREIATTYEAESNLSYAGTPFSTGPSYNLIRIPAIKTVSDSSGTLAVTDWQYDMGQPTPATMSGRDSGFDSSNITQRGNVTNLYQLKDANGGFLQTTYTYDIAGNVLSIQDVTRNTTHISYADKYSDGTNRNTYALPTSITNPLNQVSYYQYDYNTGKPTMMTDLNGIQTVYSYGTDPLDRLIQVETAKGTTADNVTNYSYSAAGYPPLSQTVTQAQTSSNDQALKSTQYWDGLGRPYETDLYTDNSQDRTRQSIKPIAMIRLAGHYR